MSETKTNLPTAAQLHDAYVKWLENTIELFRKQHIPMTRQQSEMFVTAIFSIKAGEVIHVPFTKSFAYQVLDTRFQSLGIKCEPWTVLFLTYLCTSPATAVMLAHVLSAEVRKGGSKSLDINRVAELYPMGFPTKEAFNEAWDAQKGHILGLEGVDNLLDWISFEA